MIVVIETKGGDRDDSDSKRKVDINLKCPSSGILWCLNIIE